MLLIRRTQVTLLIFSGLAISCIDSAKADAITIADPFFQLYNISTNTLRVLSGDLMRVGATSVTPNANSIPTSPTIGAATNTNGSVNLVFQPGIADPGFYAKLFPDNPPMYGPSTFNFL